VIFSARCYGSRRSIFGSKSSLMRSEFKFSVGDSLELSGISSHRRSGHDTDETVLSCLAWRCELAFRPARSSV